MDDAVAVGEGGPGRLEFGELRQVGAGGGARSAGGSASRLFQPCRVAVVEGVPFTAAA
ncbi:hypothetical protein ACFW3A_29680 [Streptomyces pilosus]|uniref:hypothetical protein n=1 Tax=Streptomyces pilosus TaxID=28893 RepID=UPI0036C90A34